MFYLTPKESIEFFSTGGWRFHENNWPLVPPEGFSAVSFMIPPGHDRMFHVFKMLIEVFPPPDGLTDGWLLWPVNIWEAGPANFHLYYKVRQAYADYRQLRQAPGHLFMHHEGNDLLTFIQLAFLFQWDFHFLCSEWGALHNDECVVLYSPNSPFFDAVKKALTDNGVKWREGAWNAA